MSLAGKSVLITGANRGIGEALVHAALDADAQHVYVAARSRHSAQHLVTQYPARITVIELDIADAGSVAAAAAAIPQLNVLINNAGIAEAGSCLDPAHFESAERQMQTNYFGALRLTQALLPALRRSNGGAIVNVASIAGLANFPGIGAYSASKAALHFLTQGLRAELQNEPIHVMGVYPGPVDTRMAAGMELPKAAPAQVAEHILNALFAKDEDVFPDDFSQQQYALYASNPKGLERRFSGMS